ncbi:MAG: response regulator [candidate division Zixibacteria bacterium]|nr:response regulator [candidate division Zixibacteria bacterium]
MSGEKILVVDDELFVRELLLEFLSKEDYEVVLADSGEKAVELFKSEPAEVALIDLKMPGMDGIKTLKKIKEVDPNTLSIIMTGYPTLESSIEALRCGAYDYVIKPFKLKKLKNSVEKALHEYNLKTEIGKLKNRIRTLEEELKKYSTLKDSS